MGSVSAEEVKKLRQQTGAGVLDCKKALSASNNSFEAAVQWLKKKGLSSAAKKSSRAASEGMVSSYIHGDGRMGVLVEVNSETDFVARNEHFKQFVKSLNLHILAMNPLYIKESDIPAAEIQKEKEALRAQARLKAKKPEVLEKIAEGLYKKWLESVCLQNQEFVRESQEEKQTVEEALNELIARVGENIVIRRFVRFVLGEGNEQKTS